MGKQLFDRNFSKILRPIVELKEMAPGIIVPITADGRCPFLKLDLGCAIYEDRPALCRKFGDESHLQMTCAHQTANGKERAAKEKKKIQRLQQQAINKALGK